MEDNSRNTRTNGVKLMEYISKTAKEVYEQQVALSTRADKPEFTVTEDDPHRTFSLTIKEMRRSNGVNESPAYHAELHQHGAHDVTRANECWVSFTTPSGGRGSHTVDQLTKKMDSGELKADIEAAIKKAIDDNLPVE